ncbi:hypothetical protein BDFB_012510, partial [Asbolus verrucosus]
AHVNTTSDALREYFRLKNVQMDCFLVIKRKIASYLNIPNVETPRQNRPIQDVLIIVHHAGLILADVTNILNVT